MQLADTIAIKAMANSELGWQGIDQKGAILTQLSEFWFNLLQSRIPGLRTHFISLGIPPTLQKRLPPDLVRPLRLRSMAVKRLKVFPIESIVRGYIAGSAWASYQNDGTVCGIKLPAGLKESEKLQRPLWTPSTKADFGGKDENISPEEGKRLLSLEMSSPSATKTPLNARLMTFSGSCQTCRRGICRSDRSTVITDIRGGQCLRCRTWYHHCGHQARVWT